MDENAAVGNPEDKDDPNKEKNEDDPNVMNVHVEPGALESLNLEPEKPVTTLLTLPFVVWKCILSYLSSNDIVRLSSILEYLQKGILTVKSFDFSACYALDVECLLKYAPSASCTSINLNHCYWLEPKTILEIISKFNLKHFHVIECEVDEKCIKAICNLKLLSLSFTYNSRWQSYFRQNLFDSFHCFASMKSLEIFCRNEFRPIANCSILKDLTRKIIRCCIELQHLKLTGPVPFRCNQQAESEYRRTSTPVPKLKSLVIDLQDYSLYFQNEVVVFLQMILRNKVVPLEFVNFGIHTCCLYINGIHSDPRILMDSSTLLLRNVENNFTFWMDCVRVQNLISQSSLKKLVIHASEPFDAESDGMCEFVENAVSNSRSTLKEIDINFGKIDNLLDCVPFIATNCPRITVLDLSLLDPTNFPLNQPTTTFPKQEALLDALSNLLNLKKLVVKGTVLEIKTSPLSFHKVTKACKQLTELAIVNFYEESKCDIDEQVLYDIVHCKNLQVLELKSFEIVCSGALFDLSQITRSCAQLQELSLCDVDGINDRLLDSSLLHAKNLKTLRACVNSDQAISKEFFDNLSQCEHLERFRCERDTIEVALCRHLVEAVVQLKNLQAVKFFVSYGVDETTDEYLAEEFRKILKERPAFYSNLFERAEPEIHKDL